MADNVYTNLLALARGHVLTEALEGQTSDDTLTLRFENIPNNQLEGAVDWLWTNRSSVTDINTEYKTFDGVWRSTKITSTRDNQRGGHIDHLFSRGYLETVLSGASIDWTEARILERKATPAGTVDNGYDSPATGDTTTAEFLTVKWPNCNPSKIESIKAEVDALGVSSFSPVIRSESYPTGMHRLATETKIEDDGSGTIFLYLAQPEFSADGYSGWLTERKELVTYHWKVPKELAQTVANNAKAKGVRVVLSYNDTTADIAIYKRVYDGGALYGEMVSKDCDAITYETQYFAVENPSLYQMPSSVSAGWTYSRPVRNNSDGSYDVSLQAKQRQKRNYPVTVSRNSELRDIYRHEILGVTSDNDIPSMSSAEQGLIYSQQIDIKADCSKDVATSLEYARAAITRYSSAATRFKGENSILYKNSLDVITSPSATGSGQYRVEQNENEDGTYDGRLVYGYGTNAGEATFQALNSSLLERDSVLYRARTGAVDAPTSVQGAIYRASNTLRDDGLYDADVSYDKSTSAYVQIVSARTAFASDKSIIYKNSTSAPTAPATVSRGQYRTSAQINEDGTYDGQLVYSLGENSGEATFQSTDSALGDADSILYRNRTTQVDAPGSIQGVIYRATNQLRDDGLYDSNITYNKSTPFSKTRVAAETAFSKTSGVIYRNGRSHVTFSSPDSGIYRLRESINDDGTYDADLTYECGTDSGEAMFESLNSALLERDTVIYRERTSQVEAGESGQGYIYTAENSLGDNGLYTSRLMYEKSQAASISHDSARSLLGSGSSIIYRNQTTVPTVPSSSSTGIGNAYRMQLSANQDGTYDAALVYSTSSAANHAFSSRMSSASDESSIVYKQSSSTISGGTAGQAGIYRVDQSIADDGTYQGQVVYTKSKELLHKQEFNGRYGKGWIYAFRNASSIEAIAALLPQYNSNQFFFQTNDDGTYSGSAVYSKPRGGSTQLTDTTALSWEDKTIQINDDGTYRLWTKTRYINYHASSGSAETAASGGFNGNVLFSNGLFKAMYESAPTVTPKYDATYL